MNANPQDDRSPGGREPARHGAAAWGSWFRWLVALTIVVPVVLLAAVAALQVEAQAPAITVSPLSGGTFQMPAGKPTILTLVDLCPVCIEDTRKLGALRKRFSDLTVLGVASRHAPQSRALSERDTPSTPVPRTGARSTRQLASLGWRS